MENQYESIINHLNDIIKKKDEIIKEKDSYINLLKEEISQLKSSQNIQSNNSNIKCPTPQSSINCLSKPPLHIKKDGGSLFCMLIMNDERIAVGGRRGELVIYNSKNFNIDIIINEHNNCWIVHLFQLKNGYIVSTAYKNGINIIKLYPNNTGYEIIQKISFADKYISQTIELQNSQLVTSRGNETKIYFYTLDNNLYKLDFDIDLKSNFRHMIEIKNNELAIINQSGILNIIDIEKRVIKKSINEIKFTNNDCGDFLCLLSNNILAIGGDSVIALVDINAYYKIREINIENSGQIYSILKFTDNIIITGDHIGNLKQWTFDEESQNLNKTSFFKDKAHSSIVRYCLKINNNLFATCSDDSYLKIWEI